jgi:hypothetical protein
MIIRYKAVSENKTWVYGFPFFGSKDCRLAPAPAMIYGVDAKDWPIIKVDTLCLSTGIMLAPPGYDGDLEPAPESLELYVGDVVEFADGTRATIEMRKGMFSCTGSSYHLGTVAFLGSGPKIVGNVFNGKVGGNGR